AAGYVVESVRTEPAVVTVEGAERDLRSLESVYTEPLSLEGAEEDLKKVLPLAYEGGYSKLAEATVEVFVNIEPADKPDESSTRSGK
nr:YbbR-like domain-containing protein [Desulfuromonadales bacterium]NIS41865.1 YbbR-like domain-containing protein [Desulfuromonadales bacterium]